MNNTCSIFGITWRDVVTTVLACGVWIVTYLILKGVLSFHAYRLGIVVLTSVGISMCVVGTNTLVPTIRSVLKVETFLGFLALIMSVYGLIVGTKEAYILVSFLILTLWGIATLRHIIFH